ncbi:MAG: hypothetical protein LBB24_03195 [Rickettsiales bacterium]|jgi:hypothetical protein|nr:hypothetical protein [Rickettsiales bacterium]
MPNSRSVVYGIFTVLLSSSIFTRIGDVHAKWLYLSEETVTEVNECGIDTVTAWREKCRFTYPDGSIYYGEWKNGKREGEGLYILFPGEDIKVEYSGMWKNDEAYGWDNYGYGGYEVLYRSRHLTKKYMGKFKDGRKGNMVLTVPNQNFDVCEGGQPDNRMNRKWKCTSSQGSRSHGVTTYKKECSVGALLEYEPYQGNIDDRTSEENSEPKPNIDISYDDINFSIHAHSTHSDDGIPEKLIRIDFAKINELLNGGIASLDDLVTERAIVDITEGIEDLERVGNFGDMVKFLRRSVEQTFETKMRYGDILNMGQYTIVTNIMLLASVSSLDELRALRFFDDTPTSEETRGYVVRSAYRDVRSFLGAFNIMDINSSAVKDLDFFSTVLITTGLNHSVSVTVNLRKIRKLLRSGKSLEDISEPVLFCSDSGRITDFYNSKNNLGDITANCMFVSQLEQKYNTCWLHAVASAAIMAENPRFFEKMDSGAIKLHTTENLLESLGDFFRKQFGAANGLPDELLVEKELKIQSILDQYGIGQYNDEPTSKLVILEGLVRQVVKYRDNEKLLEEFEKRFSVPAGGETIEQYRDRLKSEIVKIDDKYDNNEYRNGSAMVTRNLSSEGKVFLKTLEKLKIFYSFGDKLTEKPPEIEENDFDYEWVKLW